jgi:hypothetical protein
LIPPILVSLPNNSTDVNIVAVAMTGVDEVAKQLTALASLAASDQPKSISFPARKRPQSIYAAYEIKTLKC